MRSCVLEMVTGWSTGLTAFAGRFAARFSRVEPRRQMASYLRGLLAEVERKNGWSLAETVGESGPQGMQRLLNSYAWDAESVRDDVRTAVIEVLADTERGVLIADETGFVKKGTKSAGVTRQYSGTAGRTENSQIGVFLAYASDRGRALIDRELYLPKEWIVDRDRCTAAGIPDDVGFATKPELAQLMLERALTASIPFAWFTADEAYGQVGRLRLWLEEHDIAHVLAVPKSQMVISMDLRQRRAHAVIADVAPAAWQRLSCGDGAQGQRIYDWTVVDIRPLRRPEVGHWLLARRSVSDPSEIAYYICFGPAATDLQELVRVAGRRWAIEESFQTAKNETGLDHYQVRRYEAWYRHMTLSTAAAAFLVITRDAAKKGDPRPA
ncbi:IS701 family transposase [Saccharothrix sp. AJ9571]|nr:IS701 family transposase [Saccharothrix sp. AJ9571]